MTSTGAGLACPHCGGSVAMDATTCPGCGALKKIVGGGPSKKSVMIVDIVASIAGAAAGLAVRYYAFPQNAGVGDYFSAAIAGAGVCGMIVFQTRRSDGVSAPMAVWEKPKT